VPRALDCHHLIDGNKVSVTRSKFPAAAPNAGKSKEAKAGDGSSMGAPMAAPRASTAGGDRGSNAPAGTGAGGKAGAKPGLGFMPRVLKRKAVFDMGPPK
jgi:hypothetical protein